MVPAILILICTGVLMVLGGAASAAGIPADLAIQDSFSPGSGASVGEVRVIRGEAVVSHEGENLGYRAEAGMPLFKGDSLFTGDDGHLQFGLNDGSVMTLASGTTLVITKSVYDPVKKTRSSFLGMSFGKARFMVTKIAGAARSEFKVKTETAVCGVRGSDFVIVSGADTSEVTALKDTALELASLAFPGVAPVPVNDYERRGVAKGQLPSDAVRVSAREIEMMLQDFMIPGGAMQAGGPQGVAKKSDGGMQGSAGGVLYPPDDLVMPDFRTLGDIPGESVIPGFARDEMMKERMEDVGEQQESIYRDDFEIKSDEIIWQQELPGMPGTPQ